MTNTALFKYTVENPWNVNNTVQREGLLASPTFFERRNA